MREPSVAQASVKPNSWQGSRITEYRLLTAVDLPGVQDYGVLVRRGPHGVPDYGVLTVADLPGVQDYGVLVPREGTWSTGLWSIAASDLDRSTGLWSIAVSDLDQSTGLWSIAVSDPD